MYKLFLATAMTSLAIASHCYAQPETDKLAEDVRAQLRAYVETFNKRDATEVAGYWTTDAVSVQQETGERTEGRAALLTEFDQFFKDAPKAQLAGTVDQVRPISADVAIAEGNITLVTRDGESTQSAFTAVLQRKGDRWLIASSHERDLPVPETSYAALREFDWLVGNWQDKTNDASVISTVRWSSSKAFLIRSFEATFDDGDGFSGTQIFGWDPRAKQIRTWTFNSDGSFGDGTVSNSGDELMVKINQMQTDGRVASGTSVMTRIDQDTIEVQKIGESIEGEPIPASEPITVVRVAEGESVSAVQAPASEGVGR